jgi:L-alanine-DL-glutamate epimerase-like enolase superfamily enzyme
MTRIASVKAHAISVKLKHPLWTAHELLTSSSAVLVEIRTDDGLTGIGQIHGSPLKQICEYVEKLGEVARGMDALAHIAVWEKLFSLTSPRATGRRRGRATTGRRTWPPSAASTARCGTSRARR